MRITAFCLLSLALNAGLLAEDLPPPPFVAPAEDLRDAPPPPVINIEDAQVPAEAPASAEAAAPAPTPTPQPTPKPKKEKKKKGKVKATPSPTPAAGNAASAAPTMLPTEGIQTNSELGTPAVTGGEGEAPPPPVLNFASEEAAAPAPEATQTPENAAVVEAPPPPVINVPVESEAPAAPVVNAGSSYDQIGGQGGQPPVWFFTPEAMAAAPEAPVVVVAAETPTPEPAAPEAPVIFAPEAEVTPEAPPAPMISIGPEPTQVPAPAGTPEPASLTIKIEKPKPGSDVLSDTVEAELKDTPKKNPEEAFSVALMLGRGKELEARGRYYEAWRTYRDLVKDYPKDLRGWGAMNGFYARRLTERARKLEKQKRYYEAANLYRDIVTRDASVASAWWGLGALFHKYKKKEQALYCFDKVLALKPKMGELKAWVKDYREGK